MTAADGSLTCATPQNACLITGASAGQQGRGPGLVLLETPRLSTAAWCAAAAHGTRRRLSCSHRPSLIYRKQLLRRGLRALQCNSHVRGDGRPSGQAGVLGAEPHLSRHFSARLGRLGVAERGGGNPSAWARDCSGLGTGPNTPMPCLTAHLQSGPHQALFQPRLHPCAPPPPPPPPTHPPTHPVLHSCASTWAFGGCWLPTGATTTKTCLLLCLRVHLTTLTSRRLALTMRLRLTRHASGRLAARTSLMSIRPVLWRRHVQPRGALVHPQWSLQAGGAAATLCHLRKLHIHQARQRQLAPANHVSPSAVQPLSL